MQASRIVSFILTAAAIAALIACTPQDRSNALDPLGAGSNALADAFASQKVAITRATPWDKSISLAWEPTTFATNFRIYVSPTATRPTTAAVDNITNTNATLTLVSSAGSNHIWIEAVGLTAGASSSFYKTNFNSRSGWMVDGSVGAASSPSLR